jgi:hypothetical protein
LGWLALVRGIATLLIVVNLTRIFHIEGCYTTPGFCCCLGVYKTAIGKKQRITLPSKIKSFSHDQKRIYRNTGETNELPCSRGREKRGLCPSRFKNVLKADEDLTLPGFGRFYVHKRPARMGRDPKHNIKMQIPAKSVPVFKAGDALKLHVASWLKKE